MRPKILPITTFFLVSVAIYFVSISSTNELSEHNKPESEYTSHQNEENPDSEEVKYPGVPPNALVQECPGEERMKEIFTTWEPGFLAFKPEATYTERRTAWNDIVKRRGCHEFFIPEGEEIAFVRRETSTTTPGYFVMECPGIDFVVEAFEEHMEEYPKFNPGATDNDIRNEWNRVLRSINCHEFTSDNFGTTFQEFMDQNGSSTINQ